MLKGTLAVHLGLVLLRLLSSVTGDEGFPGSNFPYNSLPFFISTLREMCLDGLDPLSCQYWDSIRYQITESELPNAYQPIENKTSGKDIPEEEEITIDIPLMDVGSNPQKRFSVFRRKTSTARGYKRGPGFRSWGGKRDLLPEQEKKSKFVSWGGKRSEEIYPSDGIISDGEDIDEKRQKFQNWGGKRSSSDTSGDENEMYGNEIAKRGSIWKERLYYLGEPFKKHVPKRPQFQSWGGKRSPYPWRFFEFFHSQPRLLLGGGEKRKFSSWGGKRYDELVNLYGDSHSEGKETENSKRQAFRSWGGKRVNSENDSNALTPKESSSESRGSTKERIKREVQANEENEQVLFNRNSWGAEPRDDKNRR